ncbi:MAG TPA: MaoC family dehydratase [Mycobacterium sp.]|nr:MaoC family dehydratase [Mycobacterium sp.]
MIPPYLDDLTSGDRLPDLVYQVTQDLIDAYGMASLDLNPVHMDPQWAAGAQVFGLPETVAHGMMTMSFAGSLVLRAFGALAPVTVVDSKFTKPVPVGSTVTVRGEVRDIHPIGDGEDFAVIRVTAVDQDGDTVGVSDVRVRLPRR